MMSPKSRVGSLLVTDELVMPRTITQPLAHPSLRNAASLRRLLRRASAVLTGLLLLSGGGAFAGTVTDMELLNDRDSPQLCYQFDTPLAAGPTIDPRLYIRATPNDVAEVRPEGDRLCVEGFKHGSTYTVELLPGLPLRDGQLPTGRTDTVQMADRPAALSFPGDAYVLPRRSNAAIPLQAVNLDSAKLDLLRINDRNLAANLTRDIMANTVATWDVDQIADTDGERVWNGTITTKGQRNATTTVGVPMHAILPNPQPGLYLLTARFEDDQYWDLARQWLVITDLGVALFQAEDGLLTAVRSLDSGLPVAGAHVSLLARNNSVLGEQLSAADGTVRFAQGLLRGAGGNRPELLLAQSNEGDFTLFRLNGPAFDLSDRGVGGREHPGPIEAFITSERGIYRPGETIHALSLLRDRAGLAATGLPQTLVLRRPDGVEANRWTLTNDQAGAQTLQIPLPANARTGEWTLSAFLDPKAASIGQLTVQVEDFVPLTMDVQASSSAPLVRPGLPVKLDVAATYFYGAPAAELGGEIRPSLRPAAAPYPAWADYQFGLQDEEVTAQQLDSLPLTTDGSGKASAILDLPATLLPDVSQPLEIAATVSVFDIGGRPVNALLTLPVADGLPAIGLRGPKTALPTGSEARFSIVALDDQGTAQALDGLEYRWVYEDVDYIWYRDGGDWTYRLVVRDRQRAQGTLSVSADKPTEIAFPVDWGRYRLDIVDPKTGAASALRVRAGWSGSQDADRPDQLSISLDKPSYAVGDTARLFIDPPFAGPALIVVANERVHRMIEVQVAKGGSTVEIPVDGAWGPGTYVLATAFRPAAAEVPGARGPGRAVGVAWLGIDRSAQKLAVTLAAPAEIRPYSNLLVKASLTGPVDANTYINLVAVDEGVLRLTNYRTPDPYGVLFGKRRMLLEMRDLYGRLIQTHDRAGAIRSGGDGDQFAGIAVDIANTVALVSGPIKVGADGTAVITLSVPDFQGSLRLMALVWSGSGVGSAEQAVTVRDPLVSRLQLPRFLAPGDSADIALSLDNVSGPAGPYRVHLTAEGAVALTGLPPNASLSLNAGERRTLPLRLSGERVGTAAFTLAIDGPDGLRIDRHWQLAVRPAQPLTTDRVSTLLQPGKTLTVGPDLLQNSVEGTARLSVSLSSRPRLDVQSLLDALDKYPYGCTEQTTSRALPLLYLSEVADAWADSSAAPLAADLRVQQAVARLLAGQRDDGQFGLWAGSSSEPWLSAYVMDFLTRARERGQTVPETPWRNGLTALERHIKQSDTRQQCGADAAYALYSLSRAGAVDVAELRYYADACGEKWPSRLAAAQMGAALARAGDNKRAEQAFKTAKALIDHRSTQGVGDYGSALRDQAALVALMGEAGQPMTALLEQADPLPDMVSKARWLSTQEQGWLLLAANAFSALPDTISATRDGQPIAAGDKPLRSQDLPTTITNTGKGPLRVVVTNRAVPTEALPASDNGLSITRRWLKTDGSEIEGTSLVQNDLVLVELSGAMQQVQNRRLLVVDLLPAGLEIENTALQGTTALQEVIDPTTLTTTEHVERRDDRFVAALNMTDEQTTFRLVYLARVVTPGDFALPPALVEDMYQPAINGRTAMGRLNVVAAAR